MTARLMDLIVRYHELPKGEIVIKRDEIARELAKELGIYCAFGKPQLPIGRTMEIVWDALIDARTRLAERESQLHKLLEAAKKYRTGWNGPGVLAEVEDEIRAALAAPRKEPRNG